MIWVQNIAQQESDDAVVDRLLHEAGDLVPTRGLAGAERETVFVAQPLRKVRPDDAAACGCIRLAAPDEGIGGGSQRSRAMPLVDSLPRLCGGEALLVPQGEDLLDELLQRSEPVGSGLPLVIASRRS